MSAIHQVSTCSNARLPHSVLLASVLASFASAQLADTGKPFTFGDLAQGSIKENNKTSCPNGDDCKLVTFARKHGMLPPLKGKPPPIKKGKKEKCTGTFCGFKGQAGEAGAPGIPGVPGLPGPPGATGMPGKDGQIGHRGQNGPPGIPTTFRPETPSEKAAAATATAQALAAGSLAGPPGAPMATAALQSSMQETAPLTELDPDLKNITEPMLVPQTVVAPNGALKVVYSYVMPPAPVASTAGLNAASVPTPASVPAASSQSQAAKAMSSVDRTSNINEDSSVAHNSGDSNDSADDDSNDDAQHESSDSGAPDAAHPDRNDDDTPDGSDSIIQISSSTHAHKPSRSSIEPKATERAASNSLPSKQTVQSPKSVSSSMADLKAFNQTGFHILKGVSASMADLEAQSVLNQDKFKILHNEFEQTFAATQKEQEHEMKELGIVDDDVGESQTEVTNSVAHKSSSTPKHNKQQVLHLHEQTLMRRGESTKLSH